MSVWHDAKRDDMSLSNDGAELEIHFGYDDEGQFYVSAKIEDVIDVLGLPRWRDVREELPEIEQQVLVYMAGQFAVMMRVKMKSPECEESIAWTDGDRYYMYVEKWQPLPEGPVC